MYLWFVFLCLLKLQKCSTCLFSPFCGALGGVAYSCLFGFGRFRCFCVSCFCFLLFRLCFCLFCSVLGLLLDCFWCCSCFGLGVSLFLFLVFSLFLFVLLCLCWSVFVILVFLVLSLLAVFWFVLCVSWSGLGVVLVLFFFVCFACVCFCFFVFVSYSFLWKSHFPSNSSALGLIKKSEYLFLISVSGFCFCFVCFLFEDVLLFLCFCLFSSFVLNHNMFFLLHLVFLLLFFCFYCFGIVFDYGYLSKHLSKKGNSENPKNEKCRKTNGHVDKSN